MSLARGDRPSWAHARAWAAAVRSVLERIAGAPNYDGYLQHVRARHPDITPMTRDEFARDRLARRYDQPGSRCC
jgi:uncharacterized short protein YbdD (DUF466 family)